MAEQARGARWPTPAPSSYVLMNFFTQMIVNLWNSLPSEAVEAPSLNVFKARLDKFLNSKGIKGYGEWVGKWS